MTHSIIWSANIVLAIGAALLCGCEFRQEFTQSHQPDFKDLMRYARLSAAAYEEDPTNEWAGAEVVQIPVHDSRYFLVTRDPERRHYVSIRGTTDLANAKADAEFEKDLDQKTGVYLHHGFAEMARAIYKDVRPKLKQGYEVHVTGHSLGGAGAAILAMYLSVDEFKVKVVTYGQPKVTNLEGAKKFSWMDVTRVVDERDLVPLVPPYTFKSGINSVYGHFGREIILLDGPHYVYLEEHDAERYPVTSFWENLGNEKLADHYMKNYLSRLEPKAVSAKEVRYADRKKYERAK